MKKNRVIKNNATLLQALKQMDKIDGKLLIVLNDEELFSGLLSVGDIQRAIIQNKPLSSTVKDALRDKIKIAGPGDSFEDIKAMMLEFRMELCPVVGPDRNVLKVYYWEELFADKKMEPIRPFKLPVVIMAGGEGRRMRPLTNVLPKPLIPINKKTIIEEIIESFAVHGCSDFHISVNYKAEMIEHYLKSLNLPFNINFFKEDQPLGTAGSLSLLKHKIQETFFVSNCDILIKQDYSEILNYHYDNDNLITVVASMRNFHIPYGTIETIEGGQLINIIEKPDLTFKVNSGIYILEPEVLSYITDNDLYHITDLINDVKKQNKKIGVFPVSEGSWTDIGSWEEYFSTIKKRHTA